MATHSSVLAWRILPSVGLHRVGHDWSDLAAAAACCLNYCSLILRVEIGSISPPILYIFFKVVLAIHIKFSISLSTYTKQPLRICLGLCWIYMSIWASQNKKWKQWQTLFSWAPKSLKMVIAAMKLKDACSWKKKKKEMLAPGRKTMTKLDGIFKSRDITWPTKVHLVKAMVFPVVVWDFRVGP